MKKKLFYSLILLISLLSIFLLQDHQSKALASTKQNKNNYFEKIKNVINTRELHQKKDPFHIPLTRLDIVIDNGIVFYRLIQTYKNNSNENTGYSFRLATPIDTYITGYTIWDKGKRYPGTIVDRNKAESTYKKITGDETPTLNTDPGLLRKTDRFFAMRIFPIMPKETKQIEILWQNKVNINNGKVTLNFPINSLVRSSDVRHANIISQKTMISLIVKDQLEVNNFIGPVHKNFLKLQNEKKIKDGFYRFSVIKKTKVPNNLTISYNLKLTTMSDNKIWHYKTKRHNYFLVRNITSKTKMIIPRNDKYNFLMSVWHGEKKKVESSLIVPKVFLLEMVAWATLHSLNRKNSFFGIWKPQGSFLFKEKINQALYFSTEKLFSTKDAQKALMVALKYTMPPKLKDKKKFKQVPIEKKINQTIKKFKLKKAILFLNQFSKKQWQSLKKIIRKNRRTKFYLISENKYLPYALSRYGNVYHFSLTHGWQKKPKIKNSYVLFSKDPLHNVPSFEKSLANLLKYIPGINQNIANIKANKRIDTIDFKIGDDTPSQTIAKQNIYSNWFCIKTQSSKLNLSVSIPIVTRRVKSITNLLNIDTLGHLAKDQSKVHNKIWLDANRIKEKSFFVTSICEAPKANRISSRLRFLKNYKTGVLNYLTGKNKRNSFHIKSKEEAKSRIINFNAMIKEDQRKLIKLSRAFQFISNETAFIALPEHLRKKYNLLPATSSYSRKYNLKQFGTSGVPEPHEWLLIILMTLLISYKIYKTKKRNA